MTSFLRFFVLALTPLLGVTVSFGPALLYGLVATLLLIGVTALVFLVKPKLKEPWFWWTVAATSVLLITLIDLITTLWLPTVREVWGIYLNLLAFSPLVLVLPLERGSNPNLGPEMSVAFRTGSVLTLLWAGTALLRETIGLGTFSLIPGTLSWTLPGLSDYRLTILATGGGGFFLAAAGVVAYRALRPRLVKWSVVSDFMREGEPAAPAKTEAEVSQVESTAEWGETLSSVVSDLPSSAPSLKRRLLVIGTGSGELSYYLTMLCLEQAKSNRGFPFRVKGVDHFAARVEAAVQGVYRDNQIEFIPLELKQAWMVPAEEKHQWKVGKEARLHVQFEVADFKHGPLFFPQPCHLIVLNQGIEYVTDDKKVQLLKLVCDNLLPQGVLVVEGPFKRELLPEGMKRTGTTVFRKV